MNQSLPPMSPDQWARVQDVWFRVLEAPSAERERLIDELAGDDATVTRHVRMMLGTGDDRRSLLDEGIGGLIADVLADESPSLPPRRFGPYVIERELGRGGMGVVFLARSETTGERVAIKILADAWIDSTRLDLFVTEMQTLAALSHPSIARLRHADRLPDGTPWFAMEYVEGEPITHWVRRRRLAADRIIAMFDELCAAVQHAHRHPVIHRDLKPSNVLVTGEGAIKLLDFGIAKRYHDAQPAGDRSRTITYRLTAAYASPEQLDGRVAGVAADVYSLGIMLFELLAGRRPYDLANTPIAEYARTIRDAWPPRLDNQATRPVAGSDPVADSVPNETHQPASRLSRSERRDLEALLAAATAPDPADRYGSVEELRADIARYLEQRPLRARNAGSIYHTRKFVRRQWRPLAGVALLVILAAAGLLMHEREIRAARDAAVAEAARTNRIRRFLEDLFLGGEGSAPVDSIRVATLVENGIREAGALTTDAAMQTDLLGSLGIMTERLGNFERADSLYSAAADGATALYGPDHPEALRARIRSARLLAQRGMPDSAETVLRGLADRAAVHEAIGHPVAAEASEALGSLLRDRARYAEAIEQLEHGLALRARSDTTSREYADALRELGNAYGNNGNFAAADSLWRSALPLVRSLFGPRHPDVGFLLANLGNTASQRGELEDAERFQRESFAIMEAWYGPDSYLTGLVGGVLGQTLIRLRRYDEAVEVMQRTITALSRAPEIGPAGRETSIARSTLAIAWSGLEDHEAAVREYEAALQGLHGTVGPDDPSTLTIEGNLATELLRLGHADSAIVIVRGVLGRAIAARGETDRTVGSIRVKLGELLSAAGYHDEAIEVTNAGLAITDSVMGPRSPTSRLGRETLLGAFLAVGDSAAADRVRAQLADSTGAG